MAYDSTVPNQSNLVRGGTGDLAKMRENFVLLEPVHVSGLSGLSGVDMSTPPSVNQVLLFSGGTWRPGDQGLGDLRNVSTGGAVSGDALVYQGGDQWAPGTVAQTLGGLSDVDTSGAAVGESLVYQGGGQWAPEEITGGNFRGALVTLSGNTLISGGATLSGVTFDREVYDTDGFFSGPASGLTIPAALSGTYITLRAQAAFLASGGVGDVREIIFKKDGQDFDGMGHDYENNRQATDPKYVSVVSAPILVSGGEVFSMWVVNTGAVDLQLEAQKTWFCLVENSGGSGGASEGYDLHYATVSLSGTQPLLSGTGFVDWEVEDADTDGFWDSGDPSKFVVPSGLGFTHVRLGAGISWKTSGVAGLRNITVFKNGVSSGFNRANISIREDESNTAWSPWLPVTDGDYFQYRYSVPDGAALWDSPATWFTIEAITSGLSGGGGGGGDATFQGAMMSLSGDSADCPAAGTLSGVEWQVLDYDTAGTIASAPGSGFTIPAAWEGKYVKVEAYVVWEKVGGDHESRRIYIRKDGGGLIGHGTGYRPNINGQYIEMRTETAPMPVSGGEVYSLWIQQGSASPAPIRVGSFMALRLMGSD